tara:strand:- start:41 stop:895 length:855 start_codon:yes stop_codon:yes gene_type:complete
MNNLKMKKINLKNILRKTFNKKAKKKKQVAKKVIKVKKVPKLSNVKKIAKESKIRKKTKPISKKKEKVEKIEFKNEALRIAKSNEQKPEIKKVLQQGTEKKIYKLRQYVNYPQHGVGKITDIKKTKIGGIEVDSYFINFEKEKAEGMVPINKQSYLRPLATINQINKCISILKSKPKIKRSMWSRRATEYNEKIHSGKIYDLAEVVRDLNKGDDLMIDQSYSERQLFEKAYDRLLTEFQIVMGASFEDTQKKLNKALKRNLEKQIQKLEIKPTTEELPEQELTK